ncbi:MAG TPA: DUF302 domain-containing protein [Burkholderiales bacterium]|nr:DUF302 domain-containing protein [Burkholderiales bacterium]
MRRLSFMFLLALFMRPALAAETGIAYVDIPAQIARVQVDDSVSFDDAVDSLKLRANQHNLKFAGVSKVYKEIEALTGKKAKRVEIFNFCDGITADKMLKVEPLIVAFMPCRIAILEDAQGKRWVISMMIDPKMLDGMPPDVRKSAEHVMDSLKDMMIAASKGDL